MKENLLEVRKLSIVANTKKGKFFIVKNVSFEVNKGERLGIIGESGCGKTMTAMSIFGLLPDNCSAEGSILLNKTNLLNLKEKELNKMRGKELVLIPQNGSEFLNPVFKVKFQMYETLRLNGFKKAKEIELRIRAINLLKTVGFENPKDILEKYPFQLSGGMAQRVILAIGLASTPQIVVSDEPTRGVDEKNARLFLIQLEQVFKESAVIIITHSMSVVKRCNKILVLYAGMVMEYGPAKEILENPCHPYTKSLIAALPSNGFSILENTEKNSNQTQGCPFYGRCYKAQSKCFEKVPPLTKVENVYRRCYCV